MHHANVSPCALDIDVGYQEATHDIHVHNCFAEEHVLDQKALCTLRSFHRVIDSKNNW